MSDPSTPRPPSPRPPSPWARFTRPAPGEHRVLPEAAPPRPVAGVSAHDPSGSAAVPDIWAPAPIDGRPVDASAPVAVDDAAAARHRSGPSDFGSYFAPLDDDDDAWDPPRRTTDDPGHGLAVASIVFGIFFAPLGLVLGLVAARRSSRAGYSRRLGLIGVVVAAGVIVAVVAYGVVALDYLARLSATCAQLGAGEYVDPSGRTVTCG